MSDFREIPIIRIELERMALTLNTMLSQELAKMDVDVREAVKHFCTPENIRRILNQQVQSAVEAGITSELSAFFRYGNGRKLLRKAIEEHFSESEKANHVQD